MRKPQLTWQSGAPGRAGRWKKKYRGRTLYFPSGRGKSDREAYAAALADLDSRKRQVDDELAQASEAPFRAMITKWQAALAWSRQFNDKAMAEVAEARIKKLEGDLQAGGITKPDPKDSFDAFFRSEVRYPERHDWFSKWMDVNPFESISAAELQNSLLRADQKVSSSIDEPTRRVVETEARNRSRQEATEEGNDKYQPDQMDRMFPDALQVERQIWEDRLATLQGRAGQSTVDTIAANVDAFLAMKRGEVDAGRLSESRHYSLSVHLGELVKFLGPGASLATITSKSLLTYREELLSQLRDGRRAAATVQDHMSSTKTFVRWLWEVEAIKDFPRVLSGKSQRFRIPSEEEQSSSQIVTCSMEEIASLLGASSDRTSLYVLLALNTAMTQKDIADLKPTEFVSGDKKILRKRSKTKKHAGVPVVGHLLWPETQLLLEKERNPDTDGLLLVNRDSKPLYVEGIVNGKYRKNDNVRNAFSRVANTVGLKKPFKSLKKTSATLLRGHRDFIGVYDFFLGHAPTKIADRHYAKAPQELLDEAVLWLGEQYRSAGCFKGLDTPS